MTRTTCLGSSSGCSAVSFTDFGLNRRRELVRDSFEEERCFMMCCPTKRDDANNVLGLGMHNGHGDAAKQPESHEALLVVAKPIVFIRRGKTAKNKLRFSEV